MAGEYEALAKILSSHPQGAKILKNFERLSGALSSEDGKELTGMIAGAGGDAMKDAARAAMSGDADRAKTMVSQLLSTPEGARLAAKLIDIMKE